MQNPDENRCLQLLEMHNVPGHIVEHCRSVALVSHELAVLCNEAGISVDKGLVRAGALLHDIAKMECIELDCNHAERGAELLKSLDLDAVASVVRQHVQLDRPLDAYPVPDEAMIVNYADKRIKHTSYVSLDERFDDLLRRYGSTEAACEYLKKMFEDTKKMEKLIFERLDVEPECFRPAGFDY